MILSADEIKGMLFGWGYYHHGFKATDLDLVTVTSPQTVEAMEKWKLNYKAELEQFSWQRGQQLNLSGDVCPPTADLFGMPRCGCPDIMPLGTEEANWPKTCRDDLKLGRNFTQFPGLSAAETEMVFNAVVNTWTHALRDLVMTNEGVVGSWQGLQIFAKLKSLFGSTLANSYLANNRCTSKLEQNYNKNVNWAAISLAVTVAIHEVGHAIGLHHVSNSEATMRATISAAARARLGWPNAADLAQCRAIGYTLSGLPPLSEADLFRPRGEDPPEPPDPPDPTDDKLVFRGSINARLGSVDYGEFIMVPKRIL